MSEAVLTTSGATDREPDVEEPRQERNEEWQIARLLVQFIWPVRGRLALVAVLTVGRMICMSLVIYFLHLAIASLMPDASPTWVGGFLAAAALSLVFQIGAALCQYAGDEVQRWFLEGVEVASFRWAVKHLLLLPADFFSNQSMMRFVLQLERLQAAIRAFLNSLYMTVTRCSAIIGILIGVVPLAPVFTGLALPALFVMSLIVWQRTRHLRQVLKEEFEADIGFIHKLLSILTNLSDLKNLGLRGEALAEFDESCEALTRKSMTIARIQAGVGLWINVVGILVLTGVAAAGLGFGLETASVLTCFAALGMLLEPMSEIVRARSMMYTKVTRLNELLDLIERLRQRQQHGGTVRLGGAIETLRFERVSYSPNMKPFLWSPRKFRRQQGEEQKENTAKQPPAKILDAVTFEVRRGEILGIIGRSGAGKSTLGNLALRLLDPTEGHILINGQDAAELDLTEFWSQAAHVTQLTFQVEGTLAEEVRLVHPRGSETELEQALIEAGIDPAMQHLKLGATSLEDDGSQTAWHTRSLKQRTEWARLWLRPTQLVVLDEPTSLADASQEQRFVQSLLRHRGEWITLLVSHRPATLAVCDSLLVLDGGRVVDHGPRAEILARWLPALTAQEALAG